MDAFFETFLKVFKIAFFVKKLRQNGSLVLLQHPTHCLTPIWSFVTNLSKTLVDAPFFMWCVTTAEEMN